MGTPSARRTYEARDARIVLISLLNAFLSAKRGRVKGRSPLVWGGKPQAGYLNRMFRMETGEPLGRYIAVCKLERLRSLFQDPQVTIEWAAKQVGFSSRSYFNRFIKRETRLSPGAFQVSVMQLREGRRAEEPQ